MKRNNDSLCPKWNEIEPFLISYPRTLQSGNKSISKIEVYLKVLSLKNACQVHSVSSVSKIKSVLSIIFHAVYGIVHI